MPPDPLEQLRRLALDGVAAPAPVAFLPRVRRRGASVPEIPEGATRPVREELSLVLLEEAARWWRRATHAWVPPLAAVVARGVEDVEVRERDLVVTRVNAVHKATALPRAWVPVIVAALTGLELPAVRRALAAGARRFDRNGPCPTP